MCKHAHLFELPVITMTVGKQSFAVSVLNVHHVLYVPELTPVPQSQSYIAGLMNLRGRIIPAVSLARFLNIEINNDIDDPMGIVLEANGEYHGLIVERVEDVITFQAEHFDERTCLVQDNWQRYALGVYRRQEDLMVVLDENQLIQTFVEGS